MKQIAIRYSRPVEPTPVWLRRFTKFVAASTLFLIFAGAMVTSTGSGLAVPDWPLSYGMIFPPMVGGIFYEHGHRMIAATVGFMTVVQAVWMQLSASRKFLKVLGWVSVGAVIAQGVLGGRTVLIFLPPAISIAHAGLAELFLCLNVSIAFFASQWFGQIRKMEKGEAPVLGTAAFVLLVYAQILVGALMRHLGAGLAIPDFPLSFGAIIPAIHSLPVAVNFAHRLGALTVAASAAALWLRLRRYEAGHPLRQMIRLLLLVIVVQIGLGAFTVWSGKQPVITSLHVVTGAATLMLSLLLAIIARATAWRTARTERAPYTANEVVA